MSNTNADVINAKGGSGRDPQYENFLQHYRTVDSVTIPKEYFEKISAEERAPRAVLRTVLGNPFPMCNSLSFCGFIFTRHQLTIVLQQGTNGFFDGVHSARLHSHGLAWCGWSWCRSCVNSLSPVTVG